VPALIAKLDGGERRFELVKSVTSIGRDVQNDVRLEGARVEPRHAHVLRDRLDFRIFAASGARILVNGKKRDEHVLADGDQIDVGGYVLVYSAAASAHVSGAHLVTPARGTPVPSTFGPPRLSPPPSPSSGPTSVPPASSTPRSSVPPPASTPRPSVPPTGAVGRGPPSSTAMQLEAFKKLHTFAARLAASPSFDALKTTLVDLVIELADADSGFLILLGENGSTAIDVARDKRGADLPKDGARVSDSIVAEVVQKRRPFLISNALEDTLFGDSRSVINFRIRSVIAVPILRGDDVLGVLYLGSDRLIGAFGQDYFDVLMVFAAHAALLIENAMLVASLRAENQALVAELGDRAFGEIVGTSAAMHEVFRAVSRLAPADISVMILGETGTGKELIAHEIHRRSTRADGPFVAINVSAIPENLLESELFGHVRGAFTGAVTDRKGKFQAAHGGTLFLDEIGDMPLGLQAKILRVLQDRVLERVGSNTTSPIDIRVVSATNRDLDAMQAQGAFRPDLYFRLNEAQIHLPPLMDRGEDIALLATFFLERYNEKLGRRVRRFAAATMEGMKRYRWPGNVRELEAKVKKAVLMCEGNEIMLADLGISEGQVEEIVPLKDAKELYARRYIIEVLERNGGNRSKTARDLGIDPRTVFKYLEGK
jgi:transcriptional regulator with GAF, ATPase, and Fis domain